MQYFLRKTPIICTRKSPLVAVSLFVAGVGDPGTPGRATTSQHRTGLTEASDNKQPFADSAIVTHHLPSGAEEEYGGIGMGAGSGIRVRLESP